MSSVVLIRCDLYPGSGAGHLKRCSVLANALEKRGFSAVIVLDENSGPLPLDVAVTIERILICPYDESSDVTAIAELALRYGAHKVIGDSYRISPRWITGLQEKGLSVILIDDLQIGDDADLAIDYSPAALGRPTLSNRLFGPAFFLTDSLLVEPNKVRPRKIVLHAGGTGNFAAAQHVYSAAVVMAREKGLHLSWVCPNLESRDWILSSELSIKADDFLHWQKGRTDLWSDFDIVVGPSSTSLFEAIMQGTLPVSFPISKTQTSERSDWIKIGHALHFDFSELEDLEVLKKIMTLAFTGFSKLRSDLTEHAQLLDENGATRVAKAIAEFPKKIKNLHQVVSSGAVLNVRAVNLTDAVAFLAARNSPLVRKMSTNPNHVISWPEHLYWWLEVTTERFVIDSVDCAVAYFWHRSKRVGELDYLIGGWFPVSDKPAFAAAVQLLDWQLNYCAITFPTHTWLATINKDNRAVLSLNRRYGFIEADPTSRAAIKDLFPGSDNNFEYLQRKSLL